MQRALQFQGRKIAVLLYEAPIPFEIKEAWITLIPSMTLEQIDQLGTILENAFVNQQTQDIDAQYHQLAIAVAEEIAQREEEADEKLLHQLDVIKQMENL